MNAGFMYVYKCVCALYVTWGRTILSSIRVGNDTVHDQVPLHTFIYVPL